MLIGEEPTMLVLGLHANTLFTEVVSPMLLGLLNYMSRGIAKLWHGGFFCKNGVKILNPNNLLLVDR